MKKISILIITVLIFSAGHGQNIYYDAKKLAELKPVIFNNKVVVTKNPAAYQILRNYVPDAELTENQIATVFSGNPFLSVSAPAGEDNQYLKGNFFSSVGNLDVTNFADGLAKFLVERSKEELNVAFFRKFQDFLRKYPEARIVFPTTVSVINNIAAYNYAAMLPALRASFQKDLNAISSNLLNLRETSSYEGYGTDEIIKVRADAISHFLKDSISGRSISAAIITADEIIKGTNTADIIDQIANDKACEPEDNFSNAILFVNLISKSLRSNDDDRVWITKQQVNDLIKDDITLRIYFGLLYEADKNSSRPVKFKTLSITLQSFLTELNTKWKDPAGRKFIESFRNIALKASSVADNTKSIIAITQKSEQPSIIQYAEYASSISDFLKLTVQLLPNNPAIDSTASKLTADIKKFVTVIDAATNLCYDIKSQNYSALILHTSLLLPEIKGINPELKEKYIKYGTFMANIVEAKSSDEVKAAIETAVLPVGSSSIKRETDFNISLNAYIGPFVGAEYMPTFKKEDRYAFSYGVTAPVGIAFSWGNIWKFGCDKKPRTRGKGDNIVDVGGKSFTIFVPLIDVGAVAAFRAGDDGSKVASEVTLSNIISPGLYFYLGFGKCPISVGVGAQLGPQLREVTATDINVDKNYYVRYGLNLVVDIPFFNLYTQN
ncbi:hypothetical protein C8C83_5001 [Flavobacterium sp. 90]|uniref:hypothetical protein n=1 Tax=unclassified Flavobacterium TaxID=196869 RepID=UPI000EAF8B7D|nr:MULTISPECIES: hypothetical protein [unclassified Flavobacterium]RKR05650.1 hypothetical protein C8C82_5345 [Flavobacterium sp. 81]TCK56963.1 hypothetical protein C8C83_5001 [Flavobacterium sp. 90]